MSVAIFAGLAFHGRLVLGIVVGSTNHIHGVSASGEIDRIGLSL